jgi:LysM repeat protein
VRPLTHTTIKPNSQESVPLSEGPIALKKEPQMTYVFSRRLLVAEVVPIVILLAVPLLAHAGFFSAISGIFEEKVEASQVQDAPNAQSVALLKAATNIDPNPSKGGGDILVDEDGALVPEQSPEGLASDASVLTTNGEISVYVVRPGDSLSQIAEMYGVSANTILWANDIKSANLIQPGDSLVILPVSGVRHVVKEGDTLKSIAEKYKGNIDDIIGYNGLSAEIALRAGQTVVIPGGEVAQAVTKTATKKSVGSSGRTSSGNSSFSHPVPGAVRTQGIHGYNGVDLGAPNGTTVRAAASGEIIISKASGWNGGYGNYIVIKHPNGTQTLYAHLSINSVSAGAYVEQGETIGAVGSTGRSTGSHLHFEVRGDANPF